jgi:hypothetical protein
MKQTVSQYDFTDAFHKMRPDNFSNAGLIAMFDYFEQMDNDCGTETELDVIAICCEFTEYANLAEFQDDYGAENYPDYESISDQTCIIQSDYYAASSEEWGNNSFIIQAF